MSLDDYDWQYRETDRLNELVRSLQSQLDAAHKRYNDALIHATNAEQYQSEQLAAERKAREEAERDRDFYRTGGERTRLLDAEQRLAEEKAMRAKNIWCCGQAEKRCKELEQRLAQIEEKTIDKCISICQELNEQTEVGDYFNMAIESMRALRTAAPQEDGQLCNGKVTTEPPESRPAVAAPINRVAQEREGAISASQEQSPVPAPAATTTICGFISPGGLLCKFVPHHLHAHSWEPTAPCPLGDACPDAHKYGDVHPAPSEYAAGLAQWAELQGEKK